MSQPCDGLGQYGFVKAPIVFMAKVVDPPRIQFERPSDWTDEEWEEFVCEIQEGLDEEHL